jgi:hypothetical protein
MTYTLAAGFRILSIVIAIVKCHGCRTICAAHMRQLAAAFKFEHHLLPASRPFALLFCPQTKSYPYLNLSLVLRDLTVSQL